MFKPVALIILDGWGIREAQHGNAVVKASTPNYDRWLTKHERSILSASGKAVGLPSGQMGNSEVGHLNLGAGRIIYQELTRIDAAIEDDSFFFNETLLDGIKFVDEQQGKIHLVGLMGPGGVHSHSRHLYALLKLCEERGVVPVVHIITDGRDTPPQSGLGYVQELESYLESKPGLIASVSGRYYTMDRDKRWQRTALGYEAIFRRQGRQFDSASEAIQNSYVEGVTDEFIIPATVKVDDIDASVQPGDCILFYNFRADRMRQIVTSTIEPDFNGFDRPYLDGIKILTMTSYEDSFHVNVLFPDVDIKNTLSDVLSQHGKRQFHAAETEKYAHVTYFFNGGVETPYPGEDRLLVPSPKVATYDLKPEMSAYELTNGARDRLRTYDDDFILLNYANPDMVGHTGVLEAAAAAVEAVDECAGKLVEAIINKGGIALVTADHGNAELMVDVISGEPHTYHTTNPVSLFALCSSYVRLKPTGILADVAPTILALLGIEQPEDMTGTSLIEAISDDVGEMEA